MSVSPIAVFCNSGQLKNHVVTYELMGSTTISRYLTQSFVKWQLNGFNCKLKYIGTLNASRNYFGLLNIITRNEAESDVIITRKLRQDSEEWTHIEAEIC